MRTDLIPNMLGESPPFVAMLRHVSAAAPLSQPVLVIGERGTGKELVAARLHYLSPRWGGPYIKLNCAALSESVLDSELFGHEAGAFTGASKRRPGRFELADGGTLFLDEIATASVAIQEKILRVIEYGSFERLGGTETLTVDVRLVAATNVDLPAMVEAGRFRADLLDRLAFDVVTLPPLRERPEDIALIAERFALAMAQSLKREFFAGFTPRALAQLVAYPWPGNVRELKNVVERAVYRTPPEAGPIDEIHFDPFDSPYRPRGPVQRAPAPAAPTPEPRPSRPGIPEGPYDFCDHIREIERTLLADALERNRHNQKRTAEYLLLDYHQLRNLLRKYGFIGKGGVDGSPVAAESP